MGMENKQYTHSLFFMFPSIILHSGRRSLFWWVEGTSSIKLLFNTSCMNKVENHGWISHFMVAQVFRLWPFAKGKGLRHPPGNWGSAWGRDGTGWDGKGKEGKERGLMPVSRDARWQKPFSTSQVRTEDACGFCVAHEEFVDRAL